MILDNMILDRQPKNRYAYRFWSVTRLKVALTCTTRFQISPLASLSTHHHSRHHHLLRLRALSCLHFIVKIYLKLELFKFQLQMTLATEAPFHNAALAQCSEQSLHLP